MIKWFCYLLGLGALAVLTVGGDRTIYYNCSQNIALTPLSLNPDHPKRTRIGQLNFLKAWELGSYNIDFGGISTLTALADGRFIGVSDSGTLIGFGLTNDARTDRPFIAPLPGAFGPNQTYKDRDSEGIVHDSATGQFWVSYENHHMIRRFNTSFARSDGFVRPAAMKPWGANSGGEAIVKLADGRFVVFSEGHDRPDGSYSALIFSGDPVEKGTIVSSFGYRPPAGYKPTDATMLPDGRMLILHRRLSFPRGFSAIIAVLDPAKIVADTTIDADTIAILKSPNLVENMEGIAVTQEGGNDIIWLISDNNFNIYQRTILMKFALVKDIKKPATKNVPGFDSL